MNFSNKIFSVSFFLLATLGSLSASVIDDTSTTEHVNIVLQDLRIHHQRNWRNMTLNLEYDGAEAYAPHPQEVRDHLHAFLENYPNGKDWWEIMNVNLVNSLTQKFPELQTIRSQIVMAPDDHLTSLRASSVRYNGSTDRLEEAFEFTKTNYAICSDTFQSLDLHLSWSFRENPEKADYINYLFVDDALEEFFSEHPMSYNQWSSLRPRLETFLIERFPSMQSVQVRVTRTQ